METFILTLATLISFSTPLVFAVLGETISERVGVVNLSLEGTLLITALTGFAVAYLLGSPLIGLLSAGLVGGFVAAIIAVCDLKLYLNQLAIGFVLTIFLSKFSSYLGQKFVRLPGPYFTDLEIPLLSDIPIIGTIFFNQNPLVIGSLLSIPLVWFFLFRTRWGLELRSVGENPLSANSRGLNVQKIRLLYTIIGGILIGIGGAAFSLHAKYGWSDGHTANYGWIVLAIVIFGGWNPIRSAIGVYAFGALGVLALNLQAVTVGLSQVIPLIPFPLMILILISIQFFNKKQYKWMPLYIQSLIFGNQPQALGKTFKKEG
tara:strand:- start:1931 stop:2884 length:954 start_codon:yes stop_codon:yes gene_type:complete